MKSRRLYLYFQSGETVPQQLLASSSNDAKTQLLLQGIIAKKIKPGPLLSKRHLPQSDLMIITRQLGIMLQAGLPLIQCLQLIAQDHANPCWRFVFNDIKQVIELGQSLSQALARYPEAFPNFYREMIHTAELTGQLDTCCFQLAQQQEKSHQLRKKVRSAMRYPLFVSVVALAVVVLILLFVLPKFSQLYADFGSQLPAFTQMLVTLSEQLQQYGVIYCAIFLLLAGIYHRFFHPKAHWQQREQNLLFRIPLIGTLMHLSNLTTLFQTLSLTQKSGVSLLVGLKSAEKSVPHWQYQKALNQIQQQLEQGLLLSQCFQLSGLFPALCIQLTRVGEEAGTLDVMLERITQIYQRQTEEMAESLSQKIEPLMMLILGVIVGGLVIAIYLPILQIGQVLG